MLPSFSRFHRRRREGGKGTMAVDARKTEEGVQLPGGKS
jgi:hypothetical protein